jgi:hypothetical protein
MRISSRRQTFSYVGNSKAVAGLNKKLKEMTALIDRGRFDEVYRVWKRVRTAATKGGASSDDCAVIDFVLYVAVQDTNRARRMEPLAQARQTALDGFQRMNDERKIPQKQAQEIRELDSSLIAEFPVAAERYREISAQTGAKVRRISYICTGK